MSPLVHFAYLQLLDLLTTLAFLANGVQEANPLVRFALAAFPSPLGGLVTVKAAALLLGVYCWRSGRGRVLGRANVLFAVLVAWNLAALVLGSLER